MPLGAESQLTESQARSDIAQNWKSGGDSDNTSLTKTHVVDNLSSDQQWPELQIHVIKKKVFPDDVYGKIRGSWASFLCLVLTWGER
jgi:hypothetical protein